MMTPRALVMDLRQKYAEIRRLRLAQHSRGDRERSWPKGDPPKAALAQLAADFPGALRELDALPLEVIEARLTALAHVADGAEASLWMTAQAEYHALARGALAAKRFLGKARVIDAEVVARFHQFAAGATRPSEVSAWADDLASVARPPRGRVSGLVFEKLAARLGVPKEHAQGLVFPTAGGLGRA